MVSDARILSYRIMIGKRCLVFHIRGRAVQYMYVEASCQVLARKPLHLQPCLKTCSLVSTTNHHQSLKPQILIPRQAV